MTRKTRSGARGGGRSIGTDPSILTIEGIGAEAEAETPTEEKAGERGATIEPLDIQHTIAADMVARTKKKGHVQNTD